MNPIMQPRPLAEREIVQAAAVILAEKPFAMVSLDEVADAVDGDCVEVRRIVGSMHHLASTILDHERASMRRVQQSVTASDRPLGQVVSAFRAVGHILATDLLVRAGVRVAQESSAYFPERRLDPYRTWEDFVSSRLIEANIRGELRRGIPMERAVELIVVAGLGAKELVRIRGDWADAESVFANAATDLLELIAGDK